MEFMDAARANSAIGFGIFEGSGWVCSTACNSVLVHKLEFGRAQSSIFFLDLSIDLAHFN